MSEDVYYAIGDVHGEAEKLARLHELILEDAARVGAPFTIVHLGDLIDRGPDSRGVVARVMAMEGAQPSVNLMGNHEQMMLEAYDGEGFDSVSSWALNGGAAALMSYEAANGERSDWRQSIDRAHVYWMRDLKIQHVVEGRRILFVHAGIDPRRYPDCPDNVKLWTRSPHFFNTETWPDRDELRGLLVVHGHTPTEDGEPELLDRRINVDTGACFGGPLTCVVLAPGEAPRFLRVGSR